MSIQANINQGLSLVSLLATQSPAAKEYMTARTINTQNKEAEAGIKDINENFQRIEKGEKTPYSEEELGNIEARVGEYNKNIQNAKVAELNPKYSSHIKGTIPQSELSPTLQNIQNAIKKSRESLQAERMRQENSKRIREAILHPERGGLDG